ncbi:MAG TPA: zf-HC2 domain-containing protein [Burkholderiales bacterium]|nr:zf-HC2 domain-containing protein [Burkholderiales bacterium]
MKHIHDPQIRCEEVLRQLFAYLDREVDARTAALIDRHLEACRGCFGRASFERKLKAHLKAAAHKPAPARLRSRIKDILDKF